MKERPIIFNAEMVRATLRAVDPKTQTRRLDGLEEINERPNLWAFLGLKEGVAQWTGPGSCRYIKAVRCPYGVSGDRLWVRETWGLGGARLVDPCLNYAADGVQRPVNSGGRCGTGLWYPAGSQTHITTAQLLKPSLFHRGWRPSIHMPRWASRITLEIVRLRVQRLQEICEQDARAEGIIEVVPSLAPAFDGGGCAIGPNARVALMRLWDSIYGKREHYAWADNPWVWVVGYRLQEPAMRRAA